MNAAAAYLWGYVCRRRLWSEEAMRARTAARMWEMEIQSARVQQAATHGAGGSHGSPGGATLPSPGKHGGPGGGRDGAVQVQTA